MKLRLPLDYLSSSQAQFTLSIFGEDYRTAARITHEMPRNEWERTGRPMTVEVNLSRLDESIVYDARRLQP